MNNSLITNILCFSPFAIGFLAFLILSKREEEARVRNTIFWFISSFSIPYLWFIWTKLIKSPDDTRVFIVAFAAYLLIWLSWIILFNKENKHTKTSKFIGLLGTAIVYLWLFDDFLSHILNINIGLFSSYNMNLIRYISVFGWFWLFGTWAKNYEIVLFKEN